LADVTRARCLLLAGRLVDKRLRLIDFDHPENNRYQAVRELWVRGRLWLRRPDVGSPA